MTSWRAADHSIRSGVGDGDCIGVSVATTHQMLGVCSLNQLNRLRCCLLCPCICLPDVAVGFWPVCLLQDALCRDALCDTVWYRRVCPPSTAAATMMPRRAG